VEIPEGWSVSTARPLEVSFTPEGGETELDVDAIAQALVISTDADPRAGTFAVAHYEHSPAVPDLDSFSAAVVELLAADGSQITEPQASQIGGQESRLHQVATATGANGVQITMACGGDYFFLVALVEDPDLSDAIAALIGSLSFDPDALPA
jgi:hypothetical protein